jgi:hypothetical protein
MGVSVHFVKSANLPFRKFNNLLHLLRFGRNNVPILIFITATTEELALVAILLVDRVHLPPPRSEIQSSISPVKHCNRRGNDF